MLSSLWSGVGPHVFYKLHEIPFLNTSPTQELRGREPEVIKRAKYRYFSLRQTRCCGAGATPKSSSGYLS